MDRMSCSLWMVTVQQKAMVHSKDSTTLLEMFIKKQQIFWNTLEEKSYFIPPNSQLHLSIYFWLMKLFLYISRNLPNGPLNKHICTKDKATKKASSAVWKWNISDHKGHKQKNKRDLILTGKSLMQISPKKREPSCLTNKNKNGWNEAAFESKTFFLATYCHVMFFIRELQATVLTLQGRILLELWSPQAPRKNRNVIIIHSIFHLKKSENLHAGDCVKRTIIWHIAFK